MVIYIQYRQGISGHYCAHVRLLSVGVCACTSLLNIGVSIFHSEGITVDCFAHVSIDCVLIFVFCTFVNVITGVVICSRCIV